MSRKAYKVNKSPRYGFEFDEIPTKRGSTRGGSIVVHYEEDYASILDSTYEMAEQISTGNGIHVNEAVKQVLKDEKWRLLPKHMVQIANQIADDRLEQLFADPYHQTQLARYQK